jgi:Cdc6-like AAA superfamily ATPase
MNARQEGGSLERALAISRQLAELADGGDVSQTLRLDAERRQLLKSAQSTLRPWDEQSRAILREICALNDRTLGLMEHRRRAKGREMDIAAVGRRAVAAYGSVRMRG